MTYGVHDSRDPAPAESVHAHIKDAIKAAMESGFDVYVHAEDCTSDDDHLGSNCPCQPTRIPGRDRPTQLRRDRTPFRFRGVQGPR